MTSPTTWKQWSETARFVRSGPVQVAVHQRGADDGPVLTFLHGYPSSSFDIEPVLGHLDPAWRVVAVDLPGFGASDKPADHPYSIPGATDAVEDVWRDLDISTTVVAAHDYSVSVAQELLARHTEGSGGGTALDAVVLMNGGLYPDLHRPTRGQQALLDPEHGAEFAAAIDEAAFVKGIERTWGQRVPLDVHAATEMYASMAEHGGVAMMHTLLHYIADRREHADRWSRALEHTEVPLSFVWGDLDPVSGAHMIERVEDRCSTARVVRLADVAHWPPLEAPDVVAAEIDRLL
ncbi:MAG: alpha/beta hydrolase [Acidimicrobiales bacterium]|nr:alpha/beta hydrolase [Acidimicrobiales bacterium]